MSRTKAPAPRVATADDLCAAAMYRVLAKGSSRFVGKPLPQEWQIPQTSVAALRADFARRFPQVMQSQKTTRRGGADD